MKVQEDQALDGGTSQLIRKRRASCYHGSPQRYSDEPAPARHTGRSTTSPNRWYASMGQGHTVCAGEKGLKRQDYSWRDASRELSSGGHAAKRGRG